jgi:hypothetical protein
MRNLFYFLLLMPFSAYSQSFTTPVIVGPNGTTARALAFDLGNASYSDTLTTILGRLPEGNTVGNGTYLGVRSNVTNVINGTSFSIEHGFYGQINSSINFNRGGTYTGGFLTFSTNTNLERMRIDQNGNVGINTTSMNDKLDVNGNMYVYGTPLGLSIAVDSSTGYTVKAHSIHGGPGTSEYRTVRFDCASVEPTGGWEFYNSAGSSSLMYVSQNGNIGIGTKSPAALLDVQGSPMVGTSAVNSNNTKLYIRNGSGKNWALSAGENQVNETNFGIYDWTDNQTLPYLSITNGGNVLIGKTSQTNSSYILDVAGNVRANQLVINTTGADFVFDSSYVLPSLQSLSHYITANHHLPGIPSAIQMQADGMNLGETQTALLQKVEELTLYALDADKQIQGQKALIDRQKAQLDQQAADMTDLKAKMEKLQAVLAQIQQQVTKSGK